MFQDPSAANAGNLQLVTFIFLPSPHVTLKQIRLHPWAFLSTAP